MQGKLSIVFLLGLITAIGAALAFAAPLPKGRQPTRLAAAPAQSAKSEESDETPIGAKWWPSRWGPQDERGAANHMTSEKVLEATALIKSGQVYQLGHVYEAGMPLSGRRTFSLTIPGSPTAQPTGTNQMVSHDEIFFGEIGQVGTQMDGLGHVGVRTGGEDVFYNGFKARDFSRAYGLEKLGVENVGVFFTRGVLLDVAKYMKVGRLPAGRAIRPEDLEATMKSQEVTINPGDAVFLHTGHGQLWNVDNEAYVEAEPGITVASAKWLIEHDIVLVGADNWGIELHPQEDPDRSIEAHQWLITKNGIYQLENLDLEELAKDRVYEFAFIFAPLRLKGASGSPGNPIAVR